MGTYARKLAGSRAYLFIVSLGVIAACGGGTSTGPSEGALIITARTSGLEIDPDGYRVGVGGDRSVDIGSNSSATVRSLEPGDYRVELSGIAANCQVTGENPRTVTVASAATARTTFAVACVAVTGTLEVTTATAGDTVDTDGYSLSVSGTESRGIGVDEAITISGLSPGDHAVQLSGVSVNCTVGGENPRLVSIAAGATTRTRFEVSCVGAFFDRLAFSSDRAGNWDVWVMSIDGSSPINMTNHAATDFAADISPDGTKIVFHSGRDGDFFDVYVMNIDGTGTTRLTAVGNAWSQTPKWAPGGSQILFVSNRANPASVGADLYVMNSDGTGVIRLTSTADNGGGSWSPDGSRIAFHSRRDGNEEIYIMNANGTGLTRLTDDPAADSGPSWSADGSRVAFVSNRGGNFEIYAMDSDGSGVTQLTSFAAGIGSPAWSPDGSRIAFTSNRDGNVEIYVMNADGTGVTRLTNDPAFDDRPAWSPMK